MKSRWIIGILALVMVGSIAADQLWAGGWRARRWSSSDWHGNYYDPAWGVPHALVVPPTARRQTQWSWGVPSTRIERIDPQFQRSWPGPYFGGRHFRPTPMWPSDTNQFGVYYVRGPW